MRRRLCGLCLALLVVLVPVCALATDGTGSSAEELFTWEVGDDGVIITEYVGEVRRNIYVPETIDGLPVVEIGPEAFHASTSHKDRYVGLVSLPDSVQRIGEGAFSGQIVLTDVRLPGTLAEIPASAFQGCRGLRSIEIPRTVRKIGRDAFHTSGLRSIELPIGIETIEEGTFQDCEDLASIEIPQGVREIGALAFEGCELLTTICLPSSLEKVGQDAFLGCPLLYTVCYAGTEAAYQAMEIEGGMSDCPLLRPGVLYGRTEPPEAPDTPASDKVLPGDISIRSASPIVVRQGAQEDDQARYLTGFWVMRRRNNVPYLDGLLLRTSFDMPLGVQMLTWSKDGADYSEGVEPLTTGCVVRFYGGAAGDPPLAEAELVLYGDVLGTGNMSLSQLTRLAGAYSGAEPLEGAYLLAGDWQGNGKIDLSDLVREAELYAEPARS